MTEWGTFSFQSDVAGHVFLVAADFDNADLSAYINVPAFAPRDVYQVIWQHRDDPTITGFCQGAQLPLHIGNAGVEGADFTFGTHYIFTLVINTVDLGPQGKTGWRQMSPKLCRSFEPGIAGTKPCGQVDWLLPVVPETMV